MTIKLIIIHTIIAMITIPATAKDVEYKEEAHNFLAGSYLIIGKHYKSKQAYHGKATLSLNGNELKLTKHINEQIISGNGKVERAIFADVDVLRMKFNEHENELEATCLFKGDLDNYARITCYIYPPDMNIDEPGLEAWFIDRSKI
jgi:hypothetical protein